MACVHLVGNIGVSLADDESKPEIISKAETLLIFTVK